MGPATFARTIGTGSGQVDLVNGGFSASGGTMTVQLNGGTGSLTWGSSGFFSGGGALTLGSASSDSLVNFQNDIDLGNAERTVQVVGNPFAPVRRAARPRSRTAALRSWRGPAVLELTGTNTYSGTTHVQNDSRANPVRSEPSPLCSRMVLEHGRGDLLAIAGTGTAKRLREQRLRGVRRAMIVQLNGGRARSHGAVEFPFAGERCHWIVIGE